MKISRHQRLKDLWWFFKRVLKAALFFKTILKIITCYRQQKRKASKNILLFFEYYILKNYNNYKNNGCLALILEGINVPGYTYKKIVLNCYLKKYTHRL